jgi:putative ABC transport system permease protein
VRPLPIWLDGILQDMWQAIRALRRNPGFIITAAATLALSIGVNAAVFTLTNTVLFKGFPLVYRNDRIVYISDGGLSWADFQDWRSQAKSYAEMAAVADLPASLSDKAGAPETYGGTRVSANAFHLVHQKPILGRDFALSDETPGAAPVVILSYSLWERRYGKDPAILGQTVRLNRVPTVVIGVMPRGFAFPQRQDLWVPLVPTPDLQKREARGLWFAAARLAEGVTIKNAQAEMDTIGKALAQAYPATNQNYAPKVSTFTEWFIGRNAVTIYGSMWGAVGFVLLIACANLANLLLARAMGRSRETSVRIALGAGRWRIIQQLLIESMILSVLGGLLGWCVAKGGVHIYDLVAAPPPWFDHILDYSMDYRVFVYLVAISIGTGILFSVAPAAKLMKLDVNPLLKDGGRGSTGGKRGKHLSAFLVTGEMALAVLLLAGAGVMIRSFLKAHTADLGISTANILSMQVQLPEDKYPSADARARFHDLLKARLETIPGVESTAISSNIPLGGSMRYPYELSDSREPTDEQRRPRLSALLIGPNYFRTLGAALLAGRVFRDADGVSGVPVAIVNQRFAKQHWPGQEPLGKRIRLFEGKTPQPWLTVVGVVSNIVQYGPGRPDWNDLIYLPYRQRPDAFMFVLARTKVPAASFAAALRHEFTGIDPDLPAAWLLMPLVQRMNYGVSFNAGIATLFLVFAVLALLLASIGLYALIAHSVSQRTQEIGIRMAMGASTGEIRTLVLTQGMLPVGFGLAIGLGASFVLNPVLRSLLVGVSASDPLTLVLASATLITSAALGCFIPARRAMRVDPLVALRHE